MDTKQSQIDSGHKSAKSPTAKNSQEKKPEWANGLRELYDSVVEEPLPDSFKDLLAKLDEEQADGDKTL